MDFIAYQYDDDGYYVGEVLCQRDPKRNMPLLPRNATKVCPPEQWCILRFNKDNETWIEMSDTINDEKEEQSLLNTSIDLLNKPSKENIKLAIINLTKLL